MVDTIVLNQASHVLIYDLYKLGLLTENGVIGLGNSYVVELTDNNIKISVNNQQIYCKEYVLNELNL